ncbi:MAG: sulfurtransferase TusA family protein [Halothiobacillaceae bacterium]
MSATAGECRRLDARGLSCPMPLLKARAMLAGMSRGECLEILATDPDAEADLRAYCEQAGHRLLEVCASAGDTVVRLQKG